MSLDWTAQVTPRIRWEHAVTGTPSQVASRRAALARDANTQAAIRKVCEVAEWLVDLVAEGMEAPTLRVTSGYRGPTATGSQHDTGHALDIQIDGVTPMRLARLLHAHRNYSPHPLRQVIAESLHTDHDTLTTPMRAGGGTWLHLAIATGPWKRASTLPWATSVAPVSGSRRYVPMEGT